MRIVAGTARGRPLRGPKKAEGIRPTSDRVRETLFNVLGQWTDGLVVLDLYAGTGALALEALSRGAAKAVLVDRDPEAVELCRHNASALGFLGQVEVRQEPVGRALTRLGREGARFDLVFADPPYAVRAVGGVLEQVVTLGLLAEGGTLVVEHDRREDAPPSQGPLQRIDQRRFGDTLISLYRAA